MDKFTIETGLNNAGMPVIKCSPDYYDELINECRKMVNVSIEMGTFKTFAKTYPAICVLSQMMNIKEGLNSHNPTTNAT